MFDQRRRHRLQRRNRYGLGLDDRGDEARRARAFECSAAGEHFVEHRAERKDVRAGIDRLALELLGGHVWKRPEDRAACGQMMAVLSGADGS